jgi:hypothetical protein
MKKLKLCFDTSAVCKLFDTGDSVNTDSMVSLLCMIEKNRVGLNRLFHRFF